MKRNSSNDAVVDRLKYGSQTVSTHYVGTVSRHSMSALCLSAESGFSLPSFRSLASSSSFFRIRRPRASRRLEDDVELLPCNCRCRNKQKPIERGSKNYTGRLDRVARK